MNKMRDIAAIESSVERLRVESDARPLSARSLLLSYLLGTRPPEATASRLVDFGGLFGLRSGTVRTALSRMVAAGEATLDDGRYRLAGRLLDRQRAQEQTQRPPDDVWDGTWWTAIATTDDDRTAADRRQVRAVMIAARLGELRPGVWLRPANVEGPAGQPDLVVTRGALTSGDPAALALRLWPVDELEVASSRLLDALGPLDEALTSADRLDVDVDVRGRLLALTFEVSALVVRHLRIEPALPAGLVQMPTSRRLRREYVEVNRRFRRTLDAHL